MKVFNQIAVSCSLLLLILWGGPVYSAYAQGAGDGGEVAASPLFVSHALEVFEPGESVKVFEDVVEVEGRSARGVSVYVNGVYVTEFIPGPFNTHITLPQVGKHVLNFITEDEAGHVINVSRRVSFKALKT